MSITIVTEQFPDGIDVLVNNAGVMFLPDKATKDGYGMTVFDAHVVVLLAHICTAILDVTLTTRHILSLIHI